MACTASLHFAAGTACPLIPRHFSPPEKIFNQPHGPENQLHASGRQRRVVPEGSVRVAVPCFCFGRRRALAKDRPLPLLRLACFVRWTRLGCAAVRRAVLTGVNQTAGKLQIARMEEMDWAFVETSAHAGARPEHAKWQGRQYHRGGAITYGGKYYPDFERATGYGTGAGLCGWNCRHSFFAIDPDLSEPAYTEAELAALDAKNIEYKGKLYSRYEISQKQRALERKVRAAKKSYLAEDAAGLDTAQSAVKLKTARQNLAAFVRETGGRNDSARTFVSGFGRSEARTATAANGRNKEP